MKYAAHPKRIFGFILVAVRDFIVKRTKLVSAIINGLLGKIHGQMTEHFGERMFWYFHFISPSRKQRWEAQIRDSYSHPGPRSRQSRNESDHLRQRRRVPL